MEHNTVSNPTVSSLETKFTSLRAQYQFQCGNSYSMNCMNRLDVSVEIITKIVKLEYIYKYALNLGENSRLRMQATVSSTFLTAIFEG